MNSMIDYTCKANLEFCGLRVCLSHHLTVSADVSVRRPWRERLLSWPWRPWQAMKVITVQVPRNGAMRAGNKLYVHPETWNSFLREWEQGQYAANQGYPISTSIMNAVYGEEQ